MKTVQVISIGDVSPAFLREPEATLQTQLALSAVIGKTTLATPAYAFNKDRNQYHSNAIMRRIATLVPKRSAPGAEGGVGILAISDVDLFVPEFAFVFGEADRESKVALLSLTRLRTSSEPESLRRRVQVESLHLAGHLVGLSYCEDGRCAMFLASSVQEVDRKQASLCHVCRNELAKLR